MVWQGSRSRRREAAISARTCDPRFLSHRLMYVHIIRKRQRSTGARIHKTSCTSFSFLVRISSSQFFLRWSPTPADSSSVAFSFWPSRLVLSAMYHFQSGLLDARSLIGVMQWSIRRSHCSRPAPSLLLMRMDWATSQTCPLTWLSFRCVVKRPLSSQIPMVSADHWLTPTPEFSAQARTCRVGIWIVLASAMTYFGNQKASRYISGSQRWWMIEW